MNATTAVTAATIGPVILWMWDMVVSWQLKPMDADVAMNLGALMMALFSRFADGIK